MFIFQPQQGIILSMNPNNSQYKFLKKMSPQQKLEAAMNLYYSAKELKSAWFSQIHSEWSNQKIKQAVRDAFINARS